MLELRLEGYEPYQLTIQRTTDTGIIVADLLLTGLIGLAVDTGGGMYKLEPAEVVVTLTPSN
jgi:hypothetical protein